MESSSSKPPRDWLLPIAAVVMLAGLAAPFIPIVRAGLPNRFAIVEPGRLFRGGVPDSPAVMKKLRDEAHIAQVVDLTDAASKKRGFNEAQCAAALNIGYRSIPMPGNGRASFEDLDAAADAIAAASSQPTYFHCSAGKMRSSAAQAAYRIRRCGWTIEQALKELEDKFGMSAEGDRELFDHLRRYAAARNVK